MGEHGGGPMKTPARWVIVGGAGFIGGHVVDRLLSDPSTEAVTVYDNFSSGGEERFARHDHDTRLHVIRADVKNLDCLTEALRGRQGVVHLASNPDIARAMTEPSVDFAEGTLLTHNVLEACRVTGVGLLLYASGSGVYGDVGDHEAHEDMGPLLPVSTYGASKLAGEAMICSYGHMFGLRARAFRFGNVVGPRQTHGVGYDFVRNLLADPTRLRILGDGLQSKSYLHVADAVDAMMCAAVQGEELYTVFNVATGDYSTVQEIAGIAARGLGLDPADVVYEFTGGDRGWKGDVPVVRLNTQRIRSLGWRNTRSSAVAVREAVLAMIPEAREQMG